MLNAAKKKLKSLGGFGGLHMGGVQSDRRVQFEDLNANSAADNVRAKAIPMFSRAYARAKFLLNF